MMKTSLLVAATTLTFTSVFAQSIDNEFSAGPVASPKKGDEAPVPAVAAPAAVAPVVTTPVVTSVSPASPSPNSETQAPKVAVLDISKPPSGAPTRLTMSLPGLSPVTVSDYDSEIKDPAIRLEIARLLEIGSTSLSTRTKAKKTLASVIREMCQASKMNLVLPYPDDFADEVTVSTSDNPYRILRMLAAIYGFTMEYRPEGRAWMFYRPDIGELITREYKIRYDDLSESKLKAASFSTGLGGGASSGGYRSGGGGTNPSGSSATTGSIEVEQKLREKLERILALPTTGLTAPVQLADAVGNLQPIPASAYSPKGKSVPVQGMVEFFPSTRSALVRGTRMHHQLVEATIAAFDRPAAQVQFAVQFLEITGTENIQKGMDPTGISNPTFTLSNIRSNALNFQNGSLDPRPVGAILSMNDLVLRMNFLKTTAGAVTVDNPTIVTRNGQAFIFRNTTKEAVLSAENNFNAANSVNSTQSLDFVEIGTILTVVPRIMDPDPAIGDGKSRTIFLDCTITASTKVGEKVIKDTSVPIIASKEYTCKVFLPNGYTLAISGLREMRERLTDTGLWPLSEIPWVGWHVFTLTTLEKVDTSSLAFLTASILEPKSYDNKSKVPVLPQRDVAFDAATGHNLDWADKRMADDPEAQRRRALLFPAMSRASSLPADASAEVRRSSTESGELAQEAILARERGDLDAAKAACEKILEKSPDDKGATQFLAELNAEIRQRDAALAKKAAEVTGSNPEPGSVVLPEPKAPVSKAEVKEDPAVLPAARRVDLR